MECIFRPQTKCDSCNPPLLNIQATDDTGLVSVTYLLSFFVSLGQMVLFQPHDRIEDDTGPGRPRPYQEVPKDLEKPENCCGFPRPGSSGGN